jgi:ectoine hydroxylase-related dioxygenase (phytanoyl-CoA dioxygenase family)
VTVPRILPSKAERTSGGLGSQTIELAARDFRTAGALILEDIVEVGLIARARRAFDETYAAHIDDAGQGGVLEVGDRRLEITVDLKPPFSDPTLFANPWLWPILDATLDEGFVIDSFGIVCSFPGAPEQHRHHDGGILFPHSGIDRILPAAAIVVAIPLVEMNDIRGTTSLWLGSHRQPLSESYAGGTEPVVREGSCLLWDYRLKHSGTANRSDVARPLLYLTYCRPWWVDHVNFATRRQSRLCIRRDLAQGLKESHRRLLARAKEY